jgi:hypothetical protein
MKHTRIFFSILALVTLLLAVSSAAAQEGPSAPSAPLGTGITYQGRLVDNNTPSNGNFDFLFILYDSLVGGAQAGSTIAINDLPVSDGFFTAYPDFGTSVFNGQAHW